MLLGAYLVGRNRSQISERREEPVECRLVVHKDRGGAGMDLIVDDRSFSRQIEDV